MIRLQKGRMVGIQPTAPFGDVVAGVAVVHSAFAVEVVTAVAEGVSVATFNVFIVLLMKSLPFYFYPQAGVLLMPPKSLALASVRISKAVHANS